MSGGFYHSHLPFLPNSPSSFGIPHSNTYSSGESDSGSFSGAITAPNNLDQPYDPPYLPPSPGPDRRRPTIVPGFPEFNLVPIHAGIHRSNQASAAGAGYASSIQHGYGHNYPTNDTHPGLQHPSSEGGSQRYYRRQTQSYPSDPPPEAHSDSSSSQSQHPSPIPLELPTDLQYPWPDPGPALRKQMRVKDSVPINLWSLPDPPSGQKPSHSLPMLIKLAIYGSPRKMLTLQEIYTALVDRFEWYRENKDKTAWKNSIRHNLSLNKVFRTVQRPITEPGKGHYWRVDMSEGEGHKRPRKRRLKNKTAQTSSDDDDENDAQCATSSSGTVNGETHQGHRVGGGRERSTSERSSPYPTLSPSTGFRSSAFIDPRPRRPYRSGDSVPPSPQSTSSSSHAGSPHALIPPETLIQGQARFDQPTFGQSSFGRPSFPQSSFTNVPSTTVPSSSTISLPRAFMASQSAEQVSLGPVRDGSGQSHAVRPASTHDRYAPVVIPPPRPGIVIVDGPLPSARRVSNQQFYSPGPFSSAPGPHDPHTEPS